MSPFRDPPAEIINAWELMAGLEDEIIPGRRSVKSGPLTRSLTGIESISPMKFLSQVGSPRKSKKIAGKENKGRANNAGSTENSPKAIILKDSNSNNAKDGTKKPSPRLWASIKGSPGVKRSESLRFLSGRRILGPLFDPELLAEFEREVSEEEEEIKKMISANQSPKKSKSLLESEGFLESYKRKCPPGGQNAVVLYTTTLRGIRKTFEDCNAARSIVVAHRVQVLERDISMDSGFKEELRGLMGSKEVRVPLVFVKGRLIGGSDEVARLDEEGKLGVLLRGIPRAGPAGCKGCAGVRFVMCYECSGSCKLLGDDGRKSVKCGKCNENGLIVCPICC
ncbi:Glutaredoxin family protein [Striga hermonthica]|uniref:Glutaredoxin family protein n=1 Tax=Striga hermonthica TaxID=68872 RepID=A0A9N7R8V3_STRHE|nr:Glutaredoxin family protein [Striga hermonthica]